MPATPAAATLELLTTTAATTARVVQDILPARRVVNLITAPPIRRRFPVPVARVRPLPGSRRLPLTCRRRVKMPHLYDALMAAYDAILIPGGGLLADGTPPPWVCRRLDEAVQGADTRFFITLSRGTVHKAPPRNNRDFPIDESVASAVYLLKCGVPRERILTETASFDTIGNAYFSRVIHVDPLGLTRLLVITSDFHLPRACAIFRWVYSLSGGDHALTFQGVPDEGISEAALRARAEKERRGLESLTRLTAEIKTLEQLQQWLFLRHGAYNLEPGRPDIGDAIATY